MIVGVEFVRPDGTRARGGGKVVKNVAGFDLPKLAVGSLGTLGAIVSATVRVYPRPEASEMIVVRKQRRNVEEGDAFLAALTAARLEPTAMAWHRTGEGAPTYVIFEGSRPAVDAQVERALELASHIAGSAAPASAGERIAFWEYERDVRRRGAWRARSYTAPSLVNLAHVPPSTPGAAPACDLLPALGVFFASGVDDPRSTT